MKDVLLKGLLKGSAEAARRAIRHYVAGEHDQFLMQAAHSFELLGKARLASIHPCLIVDRDFDSFLHVCAAGKHAKRAPWNIKTITATEVLTRCIQLNPSLNEFKPRLTLLAEYRNSAKHLGEIIETEKKENFHAFLVAASLISDDMGNKRAEFFGEYEELVGTHLDTSLAEANREVAEKIVLAKATFERRYSALDETTMKLVAKSIELSYPVEKYERILFDCPACQKNGLLNGTADVDWEADYDDRDGIVTNAYPVVTMTASGFSCGFCDLSLNGAAELGAADLPTQVDIADVDPQDFYESEYQ
jgi:hypothetical protein